MRARTARSAGVFAFSILTSLFSILTALPATAAPVGFQWKTRNLALTEVPRLTIEDTADTAYVYFENSTVGIGSTAPGSALDVYGGATSSMIRLARAGAPGTLSAWKYNTGKVEFGPEGGDDLQFNTNGSAMMFLQYSTGLVGIATTSPGARLEVNAQGSEASGRPGLLVKYDNGSDRRPQLMLDEVGTGAAGGDAPWLAFKNDSLGTVWGIHGENNSTSTSAFLQFTYGTFNDGVGDSQFMVIRGDGNVGVGTTNPKNMLDVVSATPTEVIMCTNVATSASLKLLEGTDSAGSSGVHLIYDANLNKLEFRDHGPQTNLMTLMRTGNVGIGSANPQSILDIVGSTGVLMPRKADPDPTGANGMVYYNSTNNKFRGFQNGAWTDLIGGAGGSNGWTDDGTVVRLTTSTDQVGVGITLPNTIARLAVAHADFNTAGISINNLAYDSTGSYAKSFAFWQANPSGIGVIDIEDTNAMSFNSSPGADPTNRGNVGIGIGEAGASARLQIRSYAGGSGDLLLGNSGAAGIDILTPAGESLRMGANGAEAMVIMGSSNFGNVGIGTTTAYERLHVAGSPIDPTYIAAGSAVFGSTVGSGTQGGQGHGAMDLNGTTFSTTAGASHWSTNAAFDDAANGQWVQRNKNAESWLILQRAQTDGLGYMDFLRAPALGAGAQPPSFTSLMRILASGNVGIGSDNPQYRLDLNNRGLGGPDRITIHDPGTDEGLLWDETGASGLGIKAKIYVAPLGVGPFNPTDGIGYLRLINDDGIAFEPATEGTVAMIINTSNNVGIGSTNPGAKLDLNGTLRLDGATSGYSEIKAAATTTSVTYTLPTAAPTADGKVLSCLMNGTMSWATDQTGGAGSGWALNGNDITAGTDFLGTTGAGDDLVIKVANTERARFLASNGNLGIGSTNPQANLDMVAATPELRIRCTDTASTASLRFIEGNDAATSGIRLQYNATGNDLTFVNTATSVNIMTVDRDGGGRVGIGSTAPGFVLDVTGDSTTGIGLRVQGSQPSALFRVGNTNATGDYLDIEPGTSGVQFQVNDIDIMKLRSDSLVTIGNDANGVGFWQNVNGNLVIDVNNGNRVWITNEGDLGIGGEPGVGGYTLEVNGEAWKSGPGWLGPCDIRVKTEITDLSDPVGVVNRLHPVRFRYKEEYRRKHKIEDRVYCNFIAQEFREVFPDDVSDGKDGYLSIDVSSVTPYLVAAFQMQHKNLEELLTRSASHAADLTALQAKAARVEILQAEVSALRLELAELRAVVGKLASGAAKAGTAGGGR